MQEKCKLYWITREVEAVDENRPWLTRFVMIGGASVRAHCAYSSLGYFRHNSFYFSIFYTMVMKYCVKVTSSDQKLATFSRHEMKTTTRWQACTGCVEIIFTLNQCRFFQAVWMTQRHVIRLWNGNFVTFQNLYNFKIWGD